MNYFPDQKHNGTFKSIVRLNRELSSRSTDHELLSVCVQKLTFHPEIGIAVSKYLD